MDGLLFLKNEQMKNITNGNLKNLMTNTCIIFSIPYVVLDMSKDNLKSAEAYPSSTSLQTKYVYAKNI